MQVVRGVFLQIIVSLWVTLSLVSCSTGPVTVASNRHLIYGLTSQPAGIDPHVNREYELGIPLRQVYDTLVYRDPDTRAFVGGLAESWEISSDGLNYLFHLKPNVLFHDGTPFNAQAVAANLDRITSPSTASERALPLLGSYIGYDVIDDRTIRLRLSVPYAPLLDALAQPFLGMASPTALSQYSRNRYQFHQIGTGPFRFVEYVPGERIVLKRNPDYTWGPAFYRSSDSDSVEDITFRFFTDAASRAGVIANGEVHVIGDLPPADARVLTGNAVVQILPVIIAGQPTQFLMNTLRFPTDNLSFRQALFLATNRNAIVDTVYQRFSPVAWGPLSVASDFFSRALVGTYATDTAQAQELIAGLGYLDSNNDGTLDIGGNDLELRVLILPSGQIPDVVSLLQDQWRAIGVRLTVEPVPTLSVLKSRLSDGDYNLIAIQGFGVDASILNDYYARDGIENWTGFSTPDLDRLLQQGLQTVDLSMRSDYYAQIQQIIMQNALQIPIRDFVVMNAASARVQNLRYDAYGWYPLLNNVRILD